jgi:hypothetical protein
MLVSIFSLIFFFWKMEVGLYDLHAVYVAVYPPIINFWMT